LDSDNSTEPFIGDHQGQMITSTLLTVLKCKI
jgi:hypothetical protein